MEQRELLVYLGAEFAYSLTALVIPVIYIMVRRVNNKLLFLSASVGACYALQLVLLLFIAPVLAANYLLIPSMRFDGNTEPWIPIFIAIEYVSENWFLAVVLISLAAYLYVPHWLYGKYDLFSTKNRNKSI